MTLINTNRTAVFFSNPFGFGPTGTAIALIKEFKQSWPGQVIFACSEFCRTLVNDKEIETISINERDEVEIEELLHSIPNPYVISSLNRFAVKIAQRNKIPCALIDVLMWFWNKVHEDFLLADYYYVQNIPGSEKNIPSTLQKKIVLVPAIIGDLPPRKQGKHILLHIGGCQSPLYQGLQINYLNLLSSLLSGVVKSDKDFPAIYVAGGTNAIDYLKSKKSNVHLVSLDREAFLELLASSYYFITTPGLTATLEAFAIGVPTSFYLPGNLSQWALLKMLQQSKATENYLQWEDYCKLPDGFKNFTEGEAISKLEGYARDVLSNSQLMRVLQSQFLKILTTIPQKNIQQDYIEQIGVDGAKHVVADLKQKWSFRSL